MPRTITAKVDAATQGPVTRPRRLVEVAFPSGTLRLCTGATVNWSGLTWNASGVEVGNIQAERSGAERASVVLPNADRSASALVLAGPVHDSRVRVWALYGDPPYAEADPVLIFDGFVTEVPEIADLQVRLECASEHATQGEAGVPVTPHILEEALSADLVIRWGDVELTLEAPR